MAYSFLVHELQSLNYLSYDFFVDIWRHRPVSLDILIQISMARIFHQEIEIILILETFFYFDNFRAIREHFEYVPFSEHLYGFVMFYYKLLIDLFKGIFFLSVFIHHVEHSSIGAISQSFYDFEMILAQNCLSFSFFCFLAIHFCPVCPTIPSWIY